MVDREEIVAKIKRWQDEIGEMIAQLQAQGKSEKDPLLVVLQKRREEMDSFVQVVLDRSVIARGDVAFQPEPVLEEIEEKVKKVKSGIRKIKQLSTEKKRILKEISS